MSRFILRSIPSFLCFRLPTTFRVPKYNLAIPLIPSITLVCFFWPFSRKKPTFDENISQKFMVANRHLRRNCLPEADEELHNLLRVLMDAFKSGEMQEADYLNRRARVYSEMANVKLAQREFKAAEQLFVATIQDCARAGISNGDPMIVELSLKLAMIYAKLSDWQKAESGFDFCVLMQRQNVAICEREGDDAVRENGLALLGLVYNSYAHFEIQRGELAKGKQLLESALSTARKVYPSGHSNCIHLLADLANVDSRMGEPNAARKLLDEAIIVSEDNKAVSYSRLNVYLQLAVLEANQMKFVVAQEMLKKASRLLPNLMGLERQDAIREIEAVSSMITRWSEEEEKKNHERPIEVQA